MTAKTNRILSDLPSGDPALLNRISWARRWTEPEASADYALAARRKALAGHGRRSRAEQGFALRTLGWHAFWRGDLSLSMDYCVQAESLLPEKEYIAARAGIYAILGKIHTMRARFDLGMLSVERGLWLVQDDEVHNAARSDLLVTQASIQRFAGERASAGLTLGQARELGEGETIALIDAATASLLLDDGNAAKALEATQSALRTSEEMGSVVVLPLMHAVLAGCYLALSKHLDAHEQISLGLKLLREGDDMLARSMLLQRKAQLLTAKNNLDEVVDVLETAGKIAREQGFKLHAKSIALASADIYERKGDFRRAVEQHKIAWRLQNETRVR